MDLVAAFFCKRFRVIMPEALALGRKKRATLSDRPYLCVYSSTGFECGPAARTSSDMSGYFSAALSSNILASLRAALS